MKKSENYNLQICNKNLANEWNKEKNYPLLPKDFAPSSGVKVWWKCNNGHEWQATINNRSNKGSGCPFCKGCKATKLNNIVKLCPNLIREWNYKKNNSLNPEEITPKSNKKVWWICKNGHEWENTVSNRFYGNGCPFCSGKNPTSEYNLEVYSPNLSLEWNIDKNNFFPTEVTPSSGKKVWWICKKNHEWKATVASRVEGKGCPYCSGRLPTKENNFLVLYPDISKEWHFLKNSLYPQDVTPFSGRKVWWICENGHEWKTTPASRAYGSGCPYCSGNLPSPDNNLAKANPHIALEWHPTKNKELKPNNVTQFSNRKVWWKCNKGHEWRSTVVDRVKGGRNGIGCNCPFCSGKIPSVDHNLFLKNPQLASEWHPYKNKNLLPTQVTPSSSKSVWWICKNGHEWKQTVNNRCKNGCPHCCRRISKPSIKWLDELKIITREYYINIDKQRFFVDGFDSNTNVVYEFLGDYWHGNPNKFNHCDINKSAKKSFGELFLSTKRKFDTLLSFGFKIIYKWESSNISFQYNGNLQW